MANSARAIDVGSVIADTYTIEALIGRGGMGEVFLASHTRLPGKKVAIKLLHAELAEPEVLARFRREALIASKLSHPNIVAVHDFNTTPDGVPYLVLEYLEGESLAARIQRGPIGLGEVLSIVRQVGSALAAAHREGIVHRDLKPQNIFLVHTEREGHAVDVAKVLDFGISKMRDSTLKTQESVLLGTPQYMAPEQAKGEHARIDQRTDVFALGAIVYELLASRPAFSGASIPEVMFKVVYEPVVPLAQVAPGLPSHVYEAVERAMAKAPEARTPTVAAFIEELTGSPISIVRPLGSVGATGAGSAPGTAPGSGSAKIRQTGQPARDDDAFAQTMGSGDHGTSVPGTGPLAGMATVVQRPVVHAQAVTVASNGAIAVPPVERPRRPRLAIALVALVVTGAAGVGVYLATRPGGAPAPADAVVQHVPDDATLVASADARAAQVDASVAPADAVVVAEVPVDAAAAPRDAGAIGRRPPPPPPPDDDPPDNSPIAAQLRQAEAAFSARDYDLAERLANGVINAASSARQAARAHALRGAVQCIARQNEERARIDLRSISARFPKMRAQLVERCRRAGFKI